MAKYKCISKLVEVKNLPKEMQDLGKNKIMTQYFINKKLFEKCNGTCCGKSAISTCTLHNIFKD